MFFCQSADCEKMAVPLIGIYSLMLTIKFFVFGSLCIEIDLVLCDETPLLGYGQLLPLDLDASGLVGQHRKAWTRKWL